MAYPGNVALGEIIYKKNQKEALKRDLATLVNELKLQFLTESEDKSMKLYWTPEDRVAIVQDTYPINIKTGLVQIKIYGDKWPEGFFEKVKVLEKKYG